MPCVVCLTHDKYRPRFPGAFGFIVGVSRLRLTGCPPCSRTHLVLCRHLRLGPTLHPAHFLSLPWLLLFLPLSSSLLFCKLTFWVSLSVPRFLSSAWPSAPFPSLSAEFPTGPVYRGPERSETRDGPPCWFLPPPCPPAVLWGCCSGDATPQRPRLTSMSQDSGRRRRA